MDELSKADLLRYLNQHGANVEPAVTALLDDELSDRLEDLLEEIRQERIKEEEDEAFHAIYESDVYSSLYYLLTTDIQCGHTVDAVLFEIVKKLSEPPKLELVSEGDGILVMKNEYGELMEFEEVPDPDGE